MNKRIAFPFLTLDDSAVKAESWFVALDGNDWLEAGDFLENWDSSSVIRLRREIVFDQGAASDKLGIDRNELSFSLGVRVGTGPGRLPRSIILQEYSEINLVEKDILLEFEIPGDKLSIVLDITVEIVLATQLSTPNVLSPTQIGDRVWHDRCRTRLEGNEPRFPIEIVDFCSFLGDVTAASSPWYLHWSPRDWTRDFHGALRLFLNIEQSEIVERIKTQDAALLQTLMADVMSQVCERFLNDQEADDLFEQLEPGSLGAQAVAWLKQAWPSRDFDFCALSS